MIRALFRMVVLVGLGVSIPTCVAANQKDQAPRPSTNNARKLATEKGFRQALQKPLSALWEQVDLRTIALRIEETQRVAVIVDRRLDPSRPLNVSGQETPLHDLLETIAVQSQASTALVGNTVYLGPTPSAAALRTIIAQREHELADLTKSKKSALPSGINKPIDFSWDDLSQPRELIEQLAEKHKLTLQGSAQIPHDLWAQSQFPQASFVEVASAILIQWDLTFEWVDGGKGVRICPIPASIGIEKTHTPPRGVTIADWEKQLREQYPEVVLTKAGKGLRIIARVEVHEEIEQGRNPSTEKADKPRATRPASSGRQGGKEKEVRFTLRLQQKPLSALLKTLEREEHGAWRFEYDSAVLKQANIDLDERISLDVKDVSFADLLKSALKPVRLRCEIKERVVFLIPDQ